MTYKNFPAIISRDFLYIKKIRKYRMKKLKIERMLCPVRRISPDILGYGLQERHGIEQITLGRRVDGRSKYKSHKHHSGISVIKHLTYSPRDKNGMMATLALPATARTRVRQRAAFCDLPHKTAEREPPLRCFMLIGYLHVLAEFGKDFLPKKSRKPFDKITDT